VQACRAEKGPQRDDAFRNSSVVMLTLRTMDGESMDPVTAQRPSNSVGWCVCRGLDSHKAVLGCSCRSATQAPALCFILRIYYIAMPKNMCSSRTDCTAPTGCLHTRKDETAQEAQGLDVNPGCIPRVGHGNQYPQNVVRHVIALMLNGKTAYEIEKQTGLNHWTARRWFRQHKHSNGNLPTTRAMPTNIQDGVCLDENTKHEICRRFRDTGGFQSVAAFYAALRADGLSRGASYGSILALLTRHGLREPVPRQTRRHKPTPPFLLRSR
jgi:hypothetical protein